MNVDGGIQLSDLVGIVRRRAKLAGLVALVVVLAAYWLAMALPNVYTSYATVLVEPQAIDENLVRAGVEESDLNQRLNLMTAQILSRSRLSRIIDELDLYAEKSESMLREEIIGLMRSRIRVEPVLPDLQSRQARLRGGKEINQFRIHFEDPDPTVARDVAQRLAQSFIDTHIEARVQTSEQSVDFVEDELGRLAERIDTVEGRIAEIKSENAGSLPEEMDSNQRRLERVLTELAAAQRTHAEAVSDEGFYKSQLAAASLGAPNDETSPARRLEMLELQLADYESKGYTEKHPDVIKTRKEIEHLEETLEGEREADAPASALEQQTEAQMRRAALRREAAAEEVERLQSLADEIQARIKRTPAVAEQLDALNREYEHLLRSFQDFSNRRLEAGVQAQLERRQLGEKFRVLEPAFAAPEPSAPNRRLILMLGTFFALAMGGGLGLLMEVVDTSAHDSRQLQSRMQLPVLAAIPEIRLESDRHREHRRRIRTAVATAGLVLFALVGGAANYMWVNGAPGFLETALGDDRASGDSAAQAEG